MIISEQVKHTVRDKERKFEKNGMITEIDKYMWRCACEILAEWEKKGWDLFISVNISPKDFYYMDVPRYIRGLIEASC